MPELVHIVGGYDTTEKRLRSILDRVPAAITAETEVHSNVGWHWLIVRNPGVSGDDVDSALEELGAAFLRVTPENGERWCLTLGGPGRDPFRMCHLFYELFYFGIGYTEEDLLGDMAPDEIDTDMDAHLIGDMLDEHEQAGCPIPEDIADRLHDLTPLQARNELRFQLAQATSDRLARLGIDHEPDDVINTLTGVDVTTEELETVLGDLPRFLVAIGFGKLFEMTLKAQTEGGPVPEELEEYSEEPDVLDEIWDEAGCVQPVEVADGPAQRSWDRFLDIEKIGWLRNMFSYSVLELVYPDDTEPGDEWEMITLLPLRIEGQCVRVVPNPLDAPVKGPELMILALEHVPDGTQFEFRAVNYSDDEEDHEPHIFTGTVRDGVWDIQKASPATSRENLETVFEIVDEMRNADAFEARDEKELEEILKFAGQSLAFTADSIKVDGLKITTHPTAMEDLAEQVFRARCGDVWPYIGDWDM
jgi:hypothetical protein